jgi:type II secretory pathway pseudopilin PulG
MLDLKDWLTLLIAITGVLTSGIIAYLAYSLNRQAERAQTQRAINDSYNRLIAFRSEHPDALRLSQLWTEKNFDAIYAQATPEDKSWVHYYTYAELCISFINAVLYGRKSRLLDKDVYEAQYKPLIKLQLTEHDPLISGLLKSNKYVSHYIKEFRDEAEQEGWNWAEMRAQLTGSQKAET